MSRMFCCNWDMTRYQTGKNSTAHAAEPLPDRKHISFAVGRGDPISLGVVHITIGQVCKGRDPNR